MAAIEARLAADDGHWRSMQRDGKNPSATDRIIKGFDIFPDVIGRTWSGGVHPLRRPQVMPSRSGP